MELDMRTRRSVIAGILASGLLPRLGWAALGNTTFLAAAQLPDNSYGLLGMDADGQALFTVPLPGRGHAATAHPTRPEAVAFARRPGDFALIIDCKTSRQTARLQAPAGRHFYGHGCSHLMVPGFLRLKTIMRPAAVWLAFGRRERPISGWANFPLAVLARMISPGC